MISTQNELVSSLWNTAKWIPGIRYLGACSWTDVADSYSLKILVLFPQFTASFHSLSWASSHLKITVPEFCVLSLKWVLCPCRKPFQPSTYARMAGVPWEKQQDQDQIGLPNSQTTSLLFLREPVVCLLIMWYCSLYALFYTNITYRASLVLYFLAGF